MFGTNSLIVNSKDKYQDLRQIQNFDLKLSNIAIMTFRNTANTTRILILGVNA